MSTGLVIVVCSHGVDKRIIRCLMCGDNPPSVEALAEALPMHRTCDEHIRGHESCLDIARKQWANLHRG